MHIEVQPVSAMYVEPSESNSLDVPQESQVRFEIHLRTSQYLLQVVASSDCYGPCQSNPRDVLPSQFLPSPVKFKHSGEEKIVVAHVNDKNGKFFPLFQQLACNVKSSFSRFLKVQLLSLKNAYFNIIFFKSYFVHFRNPMTITVLRSTQNYSTGRALFAVYTFFRKHTSKRVCLPFIVRRKLQ